MSTAALYRQQCDAILREIPERDSPRRYDAILRALDHSQGLIDEVITALGSAETRESNHWNLYVREKERRIQCRAELIQANYELAKWRASGRAPWESESGE